MILGASLWRNCETRQDASLSIRRPCGKWAPRAGRRRPAASPAVAMAAIRPRAIRAARSVRRNHLVGDFAHAGDCLGEGEQRLVFFGRSDETPKMHHLIGDDDIAFAEIGPGLVGQPGEDRVPDIPIRRRILGRRLKAGLRRSKRLDKVGAADDSDELAILEDRNPLDAVLFEDVGELPERAYLRSRKSPWPTSPPPRGAREIWRNLGPACWRASAPRPTMASASACRPPRDAADHLR